MEDGVKDSTRSGYHLPLTNIWRVACGGTFDELAALFEVYPSIGVPKLRDEHVDWFDRVSWLGSPST